MTSLRFRIVNVFTRDAQRLSGNPLCVFEDGQALDDATMLALARQLNLSETTFILPSSRAHARIRIFTPSFEMPFAGHPTLGSAHVLRALLCSRAEPPASTQPALPEPLTLETQAGVIPVSVQVSRFTLTAKEPSPRAFAGDVEGLARALGLEPFEIAEPRWCNAGVEQLIIPARSEDAVRRAAPQLSAIRRFPSVHGKASAYLLFEPGAGNVLARFFFESDNGLLEDPATGSATANLGAFMLYTGRPLPVRFAISQGEYAGRPSSLFLNVNAERRIEVSGDVIELAAGTLTL